MTRDEIRAVVTKELRRVAPEIDPDALDPNVDLREQVDLDSMDVMNLIIAIGEELGIDIPETDYPELATLDRGVTYLERRLGEEAR